MPSNVQDASLSEHDMEVVGGESARPAKIQGISDMKGSRSGLFGQTRLCSTRSDIEIAVPTAGEFSLIEAGG
jgi:hypothetical protein